MCAFWKKLGEAVKEIDKIAKELDNTRESSKETTVKQTTSSGGLDLREILAVAEVARISDLPIDTYNSYLDDMWEGGIYTSSNPKVHTYFQAWFARKDIDGYDADNGWSYLKEVLPDLQRVQGVGDESYWSDNAFIARKGQEVLQAGGGLPLEIMKQLVKLIFDKV